MSDTIAAPAPAPMTPREQFNKLVELAKAYRAEATPINEPAADKPSGQTERTDNPDE